MTENFFAQISIQKIDEIDKYRSGFDQKRASTSSMVDNFFLLFFLWTRNGLEQNDHDFI